MITYISLEEAAEREAALVHRAEAAERELLVNGDMYDRLRTAAEGLLQHLRESYTENPCDCDGGDQGDGLCAIPHQQHCASLKPAAFTFTCPHHAAIDKALTA